MNWLNELVATCKLPRGSREPLKFGYIFYRDKRQLNFKTEDGKFALGALFITGLGPALWKQHLRYNAMFGTDVQFDLPTILWTLARYGVYAWTFLDRSKALGTHVPN